MIPATQELDGRTVARATAVLLISMIAATGATVWLVWEIRKEQHAVHEILGNRTRSAVESVGTLPGELRWQFVVTILVSIVLMSAAVGLVVVARAYSKSQASLNEVRILSTHILSSMNQGVVTTDREGRITSTNARAKELLSLPPECQHRMLSDVCPPQIPLDELRQRILASNETHTDEDFAVSRDGHALRLSVEGQLLRGAENSVLGTALLVRDVTERTLMEERLRRMERFMGLGTLVAGLHHEIKNPLSALWLHVQLLEESLAGRLDDELNENLSVLKQEVARIVGVLESFGDYASVERLNLTDVDLTSVVKHTVNVIRPKADQQQVTIELQLPTDPLPKIIADRGRLEQVLLNLVINALDEMKNGGRLTVGVALEAKRVAITVGDTGRGIPANVRSRIFDPYFTTKRRGLGMGLALCEKVIREHEGHIDVDTDDHGTQFRIVLPLDQPTTKS